jgi:hypothetical protein
MRNPVIVLVLAVLLISSMLTLRSATGQQDSTADVAAYQLGVIAEAVPGSNITYTITLTNLGPASVASFYLLDGWSVDPQGVGAFALPLTDPDFGKFTIEGSWQQLRKDEKVFAWLLRGDLLPGQTIRFDWPIRIAASYSGQLVNWARIATTGTLSGEWQKRPGTAINPPSLSSPPDPDTGNNRTPDGLTTVTKSPTGQGIDLAVFQTGLRTQVRRGEPMRSDVLVTNLGPQPISTFYLEAGTSLGADGASIYESPVTEPDFGDFTVLGRWRQLRADEEVWLWLLKGTLNAGQSVTFEWSRAVVTTQVGDVVNWAKVVANGLPVGNWIPDGTTTDAAQAIDNPADANPKNDRTTDELTTIVE